MRRVAIVLLSRANWASIESVYSALRGRDDVRTQIIAGASALLSKYGRPEVGADATVECVVEGGTPSSCARTAGLAMLGLTDALVRLRPDIVVTVGDRYETLATAYVATLLGLRIAHTMGGEVSGTQDEHFRHAITKLAHWHFVATVAAEARVRALGEAAVWHTGCPRIDIAARLPEQQPAVPWKGVGPEPRGRYVLCCQHPVAAEWELAGVHMERTLDAAVAVCEEMDARLVVLWPNADAGTDATSRAIRTARERGAPIYCVRSMPPEQYMLAMRGALCIVGNSSSAIREGAYLATPAVNVGSRQAHRERAANVRDVPHDTSSIQAAIVERSRWHRTPDLLYGDGLAGSRIATVLSTTALPETQKRCAY